MLAAEPIITKDKNNNLYVTLTGGRASVAVIEPPSSGLVGNLVEIITTSMGSPTNLAFYKNTLYKNVQDETGQKVKNIVSLIFILTEFTLFYM